MVWLSLNAWARNLNTGGHNETETRFVKAKQTIYHDRERPSHVLLPVIVEPGFEEGTGKSSEMRD